MRAARGIGIIFRQNRNRSLDQNRTGIHLGAHDMNRAATQLHAGRDGLFMGIDTLERGQQRRVDVDDPVMPGLDEPA